MKKKSCRRWVITGAVGLYVGQRLTRRQMIAEHVSDLFGLSPFSIGGLSDEQKAAWAKCRARGDRAVVATVTYPIRSPRSGK